MFEFVPEKILSKVFGRRSEPPTLAERFLEEALTWLLNLSDVLHPGQLTPAERRSVRGYLFPEGQRLVLAMADALRTAPWVFKEVEAPLALAEEMEAGLRRAAALRRLGHLLTTLSALSHDLAAREESSAVRGALDLLEHDKRLHRGGPRARRSLPPPQEDPDRERVLFTPRSIFADWQRRLRGGRP